MTRLRKYNNVKTTIYGVTFDSKKEAGRYVELRMLLRQGAISDLETQPKFQLFVNGTKVSVVQIEEEVTTEETVFI